MLTTTTDRAILARLRPLPDTWAPLPMTVPDYDTDGIDHGAIVRRAEVETAAQRARRLRD